MDGSNCSVGGCAGTRYGCCPDGTTAKDDIDGSNCADSKPKMYLVVSDAYMTMNENAEKYGIPKTLQLVWRNIGKSNLKLEGPSFVSDIEQIKEPVRNRKLGFVNSIDEKSPIKLGQKVRVTNYTFPDKPYKRLKLNFDECH